MVEKMNEVKEMFSTAGSVTIIQYRFSLNEINSSPSLRSYFYSYLQVIDRFCICTIHTQTGCRKCTFLIRALLWSRTNEVVGSALPKRNKEPPVDKFVHELKKTYYETAKESNAIDETEGDDLDRQFS